jgi:hypothetical protein
MKKHNRMNNTKLINAYHQEKEALEKKYSELFKHHLNNELSKLEQDELAHVSGCSCDGDGIATGTYSDAFNKIDCNGRITIYNNNECKGSLAYGTDESSIFKQPVDVQIETLLSLVKYNEEKQMTEQDFENLKVICDNLDSGSDLDKSMKKAIKFLL